jgi:hypothetical protein
MSELHPDQIYNLSMAEGGKFVKLNEPIASTLPHGSYAILTYSVGGEAPAQLAIPPYDEFDITYVDSGNGEGEIETITYKRGGDVVATVTFTYNSNNKLINVVVS